jgi:hypothetical protein
MCWMVCAQSMSAADETAQIRSSPRAADPSSYASVAVVSSPGVGADSSEAHGHDDVSLSTAVTMSPATQREKLRRPNGIELTVWQR